MDNAIDWLRRLELQFSKWTKETSYTGREFMQSSYGRKHVGANTAWSIVNMFKHGNQHRFTKKAKSDDIDDRMNGLDKLLESHNLFKFLGGTHSDITANGTRSKAKL